MTTLVLIAKEPLPGRAKTRLHPPLSLEQAAALAAASIEDTLAAIATVPASRRVLFFDGARVPSSAAHYDVIAQCAGDLDVRLGALFDAVTGPTVLIGMDTPQLTAAQLSVAFESWPEDIDAWLGPADDGGYWAIGLREPRGDLIRGIPMSRADTGEQQLRRLRGAGLRVGLLETLRDVDTITDARAVARAAPDTRFAQMLSAFDV